MSFSLLAWVESTNRNKKKDLIYLFANKIQNIQNQSLVFTNTNYLQISALIVLYEKVSPQPWSSDKTSFLYYFLKRKILGKTIFVDFVWRNFIVI